MLKKVITQTTIAINPLQASSNDNVAGIAKPSLMDSTVNIKKGLKEESR